MSLEPPNMPAELRDRLQEESTPERTDLEVVWDLLETLEDPLGEEADPDSAWQAIVCRHPELAELSEDGKSDDEMERTESRTESHRRQRPSRQPNHGRRRQWGLGLALAMLLLVGGIWLWLQPTTVTAPTGQHQTATLPDGSTVELNSGSTISYRRGFQSWPLVEADRRVVHLEGEAFFNVTDEERAFSVQTRKAQVAVLGTQFNVRARREESATEVTVLHGRVRVASRKRPEESVVLADSGQTSRITDDGVASTAPRQTNLDHVLAWRNGGFAVHAKPLSSVVEDLDRRYSDSVTLHSSVANAESPVSLHYPGPTELEIILHDLCAARGLNYRSTEGGYEVFAEQNQR